MKIFYYTFGCKVNQYETENVRELFEMKGHETVSNPKEADVCVINSCPKVSSFWQAVCRRLWILILMT